MSDEGQRQVAVLNQPDHAEIAGATRRAAGAARRIEGRDQSAQVQIETLGSNINAALAKVASEQATQAELEGRRKRLEAGQKDLSRYRSGILRQQMQQALGARRGSGGGDRFVFPSGSCSRRARRCWARRGQAQVARVAQVIREVSADIPPDVNWILRVDGHTDTTPVSPGSPMPTIGSCRPSGPCRWSNT